MGVSLTLWTMVYAAHLAARGGNYKLEVAPILDHQTMGKTAWEISHGEWLATFKVVPLSQLPQLLPQLLHKPRQLLHQLPQLLPKQLLPHQRLLRHYHFSVCLFVIFFNTFFIRKLFYFLTSIVCSSC